MNPAQTSWTYMTSNASDSSGLERVQHFMPDLPILIAAGSADYTAYSATSVPAMVSKVQCSANFETISNPLGSIQNDNNDINLGSMDGGAIIQVLTAEKTNWSCLAYLGTANGSATFISDSRNWNISTIEVSAITNVTFLTTPARWNMMADIISDALGTTAGYSGWDWNKVPQIVVDTL